MPINHPGFKWSGDYYGDSLSKHMHALGVVAANFNSMELSFYSLFGHYFNAAEGCESLFAQFKNNYRIETLKCLLNGYEKDVATKDSVLYFIQCFDICADNRNILMHSVPYIEYGDTELTLRKAKRNDPTRFVPIRLGFEKIRKVADEIFATDQFGIDLSFWISVRHGLLPKSDPDAPSSLPEKPPLPDKLSSLLHTDAQGWKYQPSP